MLVVPAAIQTHGITLMSWDPARHLQHFHSGLHGVGKLV